MSELFKELIEMIFARSQQKTIVKNILRTGLVKRQYSTKNSFKKQLHSTCRQKEPSSTPVNNCNFSRLTSSSRHFLARNKNAKTFFRKNFNVVGIQWIKKMGIVWIIQKRFQFHQYHQFLNKEKTFAWSVFHE